MSQRNLLWIRHALPDPDPATPAHTWPLTPKGTEAAARLARSLSELPLPLSVVASSERKAIETAAQVTDALGLDPAAISADLAEVQRPWVHGDYRAAARAYLRSGSAPGWESHADVLQRVSRALSQHWRPEGTTLVIGHGLAIGIWASDAVDGLDIVEFWEGLTFPDAWLFDEHDRSFRRLPE
ncbi:MAG: phosphoglycerate mutase family protein [Chloroflexi bacterium]|nr:phosphoglycerate mutase family protein [Chloroflexota bacterium]